MLINIVYLKKYYYFPAFFIFNVVLCQLLSRLFSLFHNLRLNHKIAFQKCDSRFDKMDFWSRTRTCAWHGDPISMYVGGKYTAAYLRYDTISHFRSLASLALLLLPFRNRGFSRFCAYIGSLDRFTLGSTDRHDLCSSSFASANMRKPQWRPAIRLRSIECCNKFDSE